MRFIKNYIIIFFSTVGVSAQTGIGTTTPVNKFQVETTAAAPLTSGIGFNGNLRLGATGANQVLDFGLGTTYGWLQARDKTSYGTNYNLLLNPNGGNVGIGTLNPTSRLNIVGGGIKIHNGFSNTTTRPSITNTTIGNYEIRGVGSAGGTSQNDSQDDGFLRLSAGGGTNANTQSSIDISGFSTVADMNNNIVMKTAGVERLRINNTGNMSITGNLTGGNAATSKLSGFVSNISTEASNRGIAVTDNGMILRCTSAITLSLPATGIPEGFNCMVLQSGSGQVSFSGTFSNRNSFTKTAGQYAIATILYIGGIYIVSGEMSN